MAKGMEANLAESTAMCRERRVISVNDVSRPFKRCAFPVSSFVEIFQNIAISTTTREAHGWQHHIEKLA
jgi:hypothetical protein